MHVTGLDKSLTRDQVQAMFAPFGEIDSCVLQSATSGIAYVNFKKHEDALKAIENLNKHKQANGEVIFVQRFISREENFTKGQSGLSRIGENIKHTYNNGIFIQFLAIEITEKLLREKFSTCGEIV